MTEKCDYRCIHLQPEIHNFPIGRTIVIDLVCAEFHCLAQNKKFKAGSTMPGVAQKFPEEAICEVPEKKKINEGN